MLIAALLMRQNIVAELPQSLSNVIGWQVTNVHW
jgi:hypothetical protein